MTSHERLGLPPHDVAVLSPLGKFTFLRVERAGGILVFNASVLYFKPTPPWLGEVTLLVTFLGSFCASCTTDMTLSRLNGAFQLGDLVSRDFI